MHKYQIVFLESLHASARESITASIQIQLKDLGVAPETYAFLDDSDVKARDKAAITVALYLGLSSPSPEASPALLELLDDSVFIVPLVRSTHDVTLFLPKELQHLNALEFSLSDQSSIRVANIALESLALLRSTRRLFISYKRSETTGVAIQLFEFLERHGFDVFLDTHSVPIGEPFQEVLWHRLSDSDVVVVLDSPDFMSSHWTMEEITRANLTSVEMVQLIWPTVDIIPDHGFNNPFFLTPQDLMVRGPNVYAQLSDDCLSRLICVIESVRARALAARHAYLVEEFIKEARLAGFDPKLLSERFITLKTKIGRSIAAVPAIGVPTARTVHDVEAQMIDHLKNKGEVVLLYDERGILAKWLAHLAWLNTYATKVQSVQVRDVANWVRSLD